MKIKVCGMRDNENISSLIALKPDFIGFIFYKNSKRYVADFPQNDFPMSIKKVGVFVNENLNGVLKKVNDYQLDFVQLHGNETPEYCEKLQFSLEFLGQPQSNESVISKPHRIKIIKAFSIDESFNFELTEPYKKQCDFFLFDTKGNEYGGTGLKFNWDNLKNYDGETPYFLSGGIGLEDVEQLLSFLKKQESDHCFGIDINSRFEDSPGLKNIERIKEFKSNLL